MSDDFNRSEGGMLRVRQSRLLDLKRHEDAKKLNKEERNFHLVAVNALLLCFISQAIPVPNALIVKE